MQEDLQVAACVLTSYFILFHDHGNMCLCNYAAECFSSTHARGQE